LVSEKKKQPHYGEALYISVLLQLLKALAYCHKNLSDYRAIEGHYSLVFLNPHPQKLYPLLPWHLL
jgi:hypothetical protein